MTAPPRPPSTIRGHVIGTMSSHAENQTDDDADQQGAWLPLATTASCATWARCPAARTRSRPGSTTGARSSATRTTSQVDHDMPDGGVGFSRTGGASGGSGVPVAERADAGLAAARSRRVGTSFGGGDQQPGRHPLHRLPRRHALLGFRLRRVHLPATKINAVFLALVLTFSPKGAKFVA